jgi:hypothetical protein
VPAGAKSDHLLSCRGNVALGLEEDKCDVAVCFELMHQLSIRQLVGAL